MNKFDRVVSVLILLQSRRKITAQQIADRFEVSLRTVYRDIRTLEEAGVPISGEAGVGYALVEGYQLPPVMFSNAEALAMIAAEKFVEQSTSEDIAQHYKSALTKIKAVLKHEGKASAERLESAIMLRNPKMRMTEPHLSELFEAVSLKRVCSILYKKADGSAADWREIEPTGCYYHFNSWYCIAWCRLRQDYRTFKVKRIQEFHMLSEVFQEEHPSVSEYIKREATESQNHLVEISFPKEMVEFLDHDRFMFGLVNQEIQGNWVKMTFMVSNLYMIARWAMMFTKHIKIEGQPEFIALIKRMVSELNEAYMSEELSVLEK